jgi:hypothetical protein
MVQVDLLHGNLNIELTWQSTGMGELHKLNEAGKYYKHYPNTSYVV